MSIIQKFLKENRIVIGEGYKFNGSDDFTVIQPRPRIECNDGFSMSVQASAHTYCSPKTSKEGTIYTSVEVGFPSESDELLIPYAEDNDYTNTIYGFVPIEIIDKVIEKHGGLKNLLTTEIKYSVE